MAALHTPAPPATPWPLVVPRHVVFTVPAFDKLKAWQRAFERAEGRQVTNSEALSRLLLDLPMP
jgi:hypothetical protein